MAFADLPSFAAWRHESDSRAGFEVVFPRPADGGVRLEGGTTGTEEDGTWSILYDITLDADWSSRTARVVGISGSGRREILLEGDGHGHWRVDGVHAAHLDGCLDVDLESSSFTNAFPVHRLGLGVGDESEAPAAWVRLDLSVERLDQSYRRLDDSGDRQRYDYYAPRDDFRSELVYDEIGFVIDYPGIAKRAA